MVEIDILSECKHKHVVGMYEAYYHENKLWVSVQDTCTWLTVAFRPQYIILHAFYVQCSTTSYSLLSKCLLSRIGNIFCVFFCSVITMLGEVWQNRKYCRIMSHGSVFPKLFHALPNVCEKPQPLCEKEWKITQSISDYQNVNSLHPPHY